MLNETDILDEAALESFRDFLQPELEKDGYHFFLGSFANSLCLGQIRDSTGYVICERTTFQHSNARPIEALCFLGYETFNPDKLFFKFSPAENISSKVFDAKRIALKHNFSGTLELIASKTKEFEIRLMAFCAGELKSSMKTVLVDGNSELSDYQKGAIKEYLKEVFNALVLKNKDFPGTPILRELMNQYFQGEPRHMQPVLLKTNSILFNFLKSQAKDEHKNIFGTELKINPEGYSIYQSR